MLQLPQSNNTTTVTSGNMKTVILPSGDVYAYKVSPRADGTKCETHHYSHHKFKGGAFN